MSMVRSVRPGLDVAGADSARSYGSVALASSHTAENSGWLHPRGLRAQHRTFDFIVHRRMQRVAPFGKSATRRT